MWLLFATITVLLWGTSETIFKKVSTIEKHSVLKLISYNGIMLGICALIFMLITRTQMNLEIIKTYLPIALIYIVSMFCTYKAMTLVKVSILSPLQNSSCAITTILCIVLLKQEVGIPQIIAIVVIIIAMILLSINKDEVLRLESGDKEADERNAKRSDNMDINQIFNMIDDKYIANNDLKNQEQGIEEGKKVKNMSVFFQPKENKGVWEKIGTVVS